MIKIVIVEDENIVRLGLSVLVDWESQGFHIAGLFKNGKEALEYLKKNPDIDIVITDIRMPVMGGEELAANIRRITDSIDILVLSNYDDFEIVKNCFKIGISDYVLKQDIEPDSFLELLKGIAEKKESRAGTEAKREDSVQDFFLELKKREWLPKGQDFKEKYGDIQAGLREKMFVLMVYTFTDDKNHRIYEGQKIRIDILQECIRENSREYFQNLVLLRDSDKYLAILWQDKEEILEAEEHRCRLWSQRISLVIKEYFNLNLQGGITDTAGKFEELGQCYRQALHSWKLLFYYPEKQILFGKKGADDFQKQNDFFDCLKEVRFCLEFNNFVILKSSLEKFYGTLKREKNLDPDSVLRFTSNLFMEMNYFLVENTKAKLEDFGFDWEWLENMYFTVDSLKAEVLFYIDKILEYLRSYEAHYEVIARMKWIISKKYAQELSLQELADMLNIHPGYLSSLFKKKTGISFVQYLTNYRMKKAVELLRTTGNSVEEIAEQVGYQNANYFVKVFKKTVGMTISEFRKMELEYEKKE